LAPGIRESHKKKTPKSDFLLLMKQLCSRHGTIWKDGLEHTAKFRNLSRFYIISR
jgi:hypothetical protein